MIGNRDPQNHNHISPFRGHAYPSAIGWHVPIIIAISSIAFALIPAVTCSQVEPSTDFDFARVMYGPWSVAELGKFSFEAKYRNSWWHHSGRERVLARFAEESLEAAANNVTYVAGLYYHAAPWDRLPFNYTHAVHESGVVEPYTPSPIDPTWWEKTMHEPAVAVANLSLYYPIWGLVWDIELYGHAAMLRHDYSYDLPAVYAFANATNTTIPPLEPNAAFFWLRREGLLGQYHSWMEDVMYKMAKRTEQAVHAINPKFNLGLLGTEDSWHHWTILKAFNSSTASVTSWGEQTYGGYREDAVEFFQNKFRELGLHGKYVPGVRPAASLGKFMWDLGSAVRKNGVFWIYQHNGDPWAYKPNETYVKMYQLFDQYVFFNGSDVYPIPEFELLPGAGAHPYMGPNGTLSLFIFTQLQDKPFEKELLPFGFGVLTDAPELVYVGENLSRKVVAGRNLYLKPEDLPCILYGLDQEDFVATEALALVRELESLIAIFNAAGIGSPPFAENLLNQTRTDLGAGRYVGARDMLLERRNETYAYALEAVRPLVEAGFANPRESEIPLTVLRTFYLAEGEINRGEVRKGELTLLGGLQDLSKYVDEPTLEWTVVLGAVLFLLGLKIPSSRRVIT